jgi:hypothetical protein
MNATTGTETKTPTGGVVDEVDPGSGTAEVVEPVSITSTALTSGAGGGGGTTKASLAERFVRASSPRVEVPPSLEGEEKEEEKVEQDKMEVST